SNEMVALYLKLCDLEFALKESQKSLAVAEQLAGSDQATLLVDTLVLLARVYTRRNEIPLALQQLARALPLNQQLKYLDGEAKTRGQYGHTYSETNKLDKATEMNNLALNIWREAPNKPAEAQALIIQGEVYMVKDHSAEAMASLKEAETIYRSLNDA